LSKLNAFGWFYAADIEVNDDEIYEENAFQVHVALSLTEIIVI